MKYFLTLILFSISLLAQEPTDTDGDGYLNISTLGHLRWLSESPEAWDKNFELDNDIDASDTRDWNIGDHDNNPATPDSAMGWNPIGNKDNRFLGNFEGNNFSVSNLYVNRPTQNYIGFFGLSWENIDNFKLHNAIITGYGKVGILAGVKWGREVNNCSVSGLVNGHVSVAGFIGEFMETSLGNEITSIISSSNSSATVSGRFGVAGFIGSNLGNIENCSSQSLINCEGPAGGFISNNKGWIIDSHCKSIISGEIYLGGFLGINDEDGFVNNCTSTFSIAGGEKCGGFVGENKSLIINSSSVGSIGGEELIGGFVGSNSGRISGSHSKSEIIGIVDVGGFAGDNSNKINDCWSIGSVEGQFFVGGFIGRNYEEIEICFSNSSTKGDEYVGGFIGYATNRITNCYSLGDVEGKSLCGGFTSTLVKDAVIKNSYSIGNVKGKSSSMGFIGRNDSKLDSNCFWDIEHSQNFESSGGTGITTTEMKDINTFLDAGWDFENIWAIDGVTNNGYPFFRDQITSVKESIYEKNDIKIYPNPTSDLISFRNLSEDIINIEIYDIYGKLVLELNEKKEIIDVSNLKASKYFLQIQTFSRDYKLSFIKI